MIPAGQTPDLVNTPDPVNTYRHRSMSGDIVITEKNSQARDVRAALYGEAGDRVVVVSGRGLLANAVEPIADFFSGDPDARSGVRVGRADADGDGNADILAASGRRLAVYAWPNFADATPLAPGTDLPVAPAAIG